MFNKEIGQKGDAGSRSPSPSTISLIALVHRALFIRSEILQKDDPGTRTEFDLQDGEPRAILRLISSEGNVILKEFFETTSSPDRPGRKDEYVDAARKYHRLAVHYPGMLFPQEYAIRSLAELWAKIRELGAGGDLSLSGFLYDDDGNTMMSV